MHISEVYRSTLPVFGVVVQEDDSLTMLLGNDNPVPLMINHKPVVLPTKPRVDGKIDNSVILFHPCVEDVMKKPTATLLTMASTASFFYSYHFLALTGILAHILSSQEELDQVSPQMRTLLLDNYAFPHLTNADASHIMAWVETMSLESSPIDHMLSISLRSTRSTEEGLRVAAVHSNAQEEVNTAVNDGLSSIGDVKMSKKSIKALSQILNTLLPPADMSPVVNSFTTCPGYEVLWTSCSRYASTLWTFKELLGADEFVLWGMIKDSLNAAVLESRDQKDLAMTIATLTSTEGNRPLKRKMNSISMDVPSSSPPVDVPWDTASPHAAPPATMPPPSPPPMQSYTQTMQPAPAEPPKSNGEFATLPAWMTATVANQQMYPQVPQGQYPGQYANPAMMYPQVPQGQFPGQQMMYPQAPQGQYPAPYAGQQMMYPQGQYPAPYPGQQMVYPNGQAMPFPGQQIPYQPYRPQGYVGNNPTWYGR